MPAPRNLWSSLRPRRTGGWAAALTALVGLPLILAALGRNEGVPYVSIELRTETIAYRVVRPAVAGIAFDEAAIPGVDCPAAASGDGKTMRGLIEPALDTIVRYRIAKGAISIEITGKEGSLGTLATADDRECALPAHNLKLTISDPADAVTWPLPIAGPADAGRELQGATAPKTGAGDGQGPMRVASLLLDGSVRLYGRTTLPWKAPALYPVQDTEFPIPAGSRLASGEDIGDPARAGNAWYGLASPDMSAETGSFFKVSATTDSASLVLFRPGSGNQKETFAMGLFARIFNDPSFAGLSFCLLILTVTAQVLTGWMGLWRERRR